MQIKMELDVPVEYFFHRLMESALYDVHLHSGKNISAVHLKNYTYRKKMGNGATARCTITDYVPNQKYGYTMHTGRNDFAVSYEVAALPDNRMALTYAEAVTGANRTVDANNRAGSILMGWFRKRRFRKMSRQIEASYMTELQV